MNICLYGASSTELDARYLDAAYDLGRRIAAGGHTMVYGGGAQGVMGAAARGVVDGGGALVGIAPTFFKRAPGVLFDGCTMHEGDVFYADGWQKPDGFCDSAWQTLSPFALALSHGAEGFYDGWMKNPRSAMLSCNDGFRPATFLLEALDEDAD